MDSAGGLCVSSGFVYVMLATWLADDVPSTIPANASHQVGVGAFVLNAKAEVCHTRAL